MPEAEAKDLEKKPETESPSNETPSSADAPKADTKTNQGTLTSRPPYGAAGQKVARRRKHKRIALVVGGVTLTGILLLGIISFLGQISSNFTISIDPKVAESTLGLSLDPTGTTTSSYLKADGMTGAQPVYADDAIGHIKSVYEEAEEAGSFVAGNNNYEVSTSGGETYSGALIYTFYVHNLHYESVSYTATFSISDYEAPSNSGANQPYAYLRVAAYENLYGSSTHERSVYGLDNSSTTVLGEESDYREAISSFNKYDENEKKLSSDATSYTYREAAGNTLEENNDYCESFSSITDMKIFERDVTLAVGEIMRYTIVCWFDGEDPDCSGITPSGSSMTFALNFVTSR